MNTFSCEVILFISFNADDVVANLTQDYVDPFFQLLRKCPNLETLSLSDSSIRYISIPESFPRLRSIFFNCFFFSFSCSIDLPALLSITIQAKSLPKLSGFTLTSLPSLQTLFIQSHCAFQLDPLTISQDPERWRRESAFLNKRFVLSGNPMKNIIRKDLPQLVQVEIAPLSFVDTVVFEVKSGIRGTDTLQTRHIFVKSTSEAVRSLPTISQTVLPLRCVTWSRWRRWRLVRVVLSFRICYLCEIFPN